MVLYRIAQARHAADLSGEGARLTKGRWNPIGVPMVYTASSVALAAMEVFVNVPHDIVTAVDFKRVDIYVPDIARVEYLEVSDLSSDWSAIPAPDSIVEIGRAWADSCRTLLMRVPSAALRGHEFNFLINPRHPEMKDVKVISVTPFIYDSRML
jgi:RES domain-containing protein